MRAKTTLLGRGTPGYRAPELLREDHLTFNNKVDIWAMGCILYQIVFRVKAFHNDYAVLNYALTKTAMEMPAEFSSECNLTGNNELTRLMLIINSMLNLNPARRPPAELLGRLFNDACNWTAIQSNTEHISEPLSLVDLAAILERTKDLGGIFGGSYLLIIC